MGIAENLKSFREKADLSQSGLARKARVSQQLISQIERGENTTTKYLPQIARALGVSIFELDPAFQVSALDSASEKATELMVIAQRLAPYPDLLSHLLQQARKAEELARALEEPPEPTVANGKR